MLPVLDERTRRLGAALRKQGRRVGERTVHQLLHGLGHGLRANRKTVEGRQAA